MDTDYWFEGTIISPRAKTTLKSWIVWLRIFYLSQTPLMGLHWICCCCCCHCTIWRCTPLFWYLEKITRKSFSLVCNLYDYLLVVVTLPTPTCLGRSCYSLVVATTTHLRSFLVLWIRKFSFYYSLNLNSVRKRDVKKKKVSKRRNTKL